LLSRSEFAPIVLVWLEDTPTPPDRPGLQRVHGRKIDRAALAREAREHAETSVAAP